MNNVYLLRKSAITQSRGNSWVLCQQFHQIVCRMKSLNYTKTTAIMKKYIAMSVTGKAQTAMKAYRKKIAFI